MKTTTKKRILFIIICAVTLAIWGMSLLNSNVSLKQSEIIVEPMMDQITSSGDILSRFPTPGNWTDFFTRLIRKSAHFLEFALLGMLWGGYSRLKKLRLPWLYGLVVAAIDETIQYFVPGRCPGVWDVVLDYAGYLFGFGLVVLFATWIRKKTKK